MTVQKTIIDGEQKLRKAAELSLMTSSLSNYVVRDSFRGHFFACVFRTQ